MDIKVLENFLQIADLGSLSRAADRLRLAQPVLSRQIRLLEDNAGTELFSRHRRGMQLTKAGEELRDHLSTPIRQIRNAFDDIRERSLEASAHIALGLPPTVSHVLAGRLARRSAQQAPNISLRIVEGYDGHLVDWLHRGELDAALLYGPSANFQMPTEDLLWEDLMLIGSPSADIGPDLPIEVETLAGLPLVLPSQPHGLRLVVEAAARKAHIHLNIRYEADSFIVLKDLVASGLGYTVLPLSAAQSEIEAGTLRYAPLSNPSVVRQLVLAAPRVEKLSRSARIIIRLIREEIRDLAQSGDWKVRLQS